MKRQTDFHNRGFSTIEDEQFDDQRLKKQTIDQTENSGDLSSSLKRRISPCESHVARVRNKINENINNSENILIVKCLKD